MTSFFDLGPAVVSFFGFFPDFSGILSPFSGGSSIKLVPPETALQVRRALADPIFCLEPCRTSQGGEALTWYRHYSRNGYPLFSTDFLIDRNTWLVQSCYSNLVIGLYEDDIPYPYFLHNMRLESYLSGSNEYIPYWVRV